MKITNSNLDALRVSLSLAFEAGFAGTGSWWNRLALDSMVDEVTGRYGWIANLPQVKQWLGDRVVQNLGEHNYDIVNLDREITLGIKRNDLDTKALGGYASAMRAMGEAAAKHPDSLITTLMKDGEVTLCFDGQYFFDTDHPVSKFNSGLGTYSNYDSSGKPLTLDNYVAARAAMMGRKGENNLILGVNPNLLVVPPQLEHVGRQILMSDYVVNTAGATPAAGATGMTNVMKGTAELLVIPELADEATTWYLFDTRRVIKPFIYQHRSGFDFSILGPESEHFKKHNEALIMADAQDAAGYGLPQLAYKGVA